MPRQPLDDKVVRQTVRAYRKNKTISATAVALGVAPGTVKYRLKIAAERDMYLKAAHLHATKTREPKEIKVEAPVVGCPNCGGKWVNAELTLDCGCSISAHVEPAASEQLMNNPLRRFNMTCEQHGETTLSTFSPL